MITKEKDGFLWEEVGSSKALLRLCCLYYGSIKTLSRLYEDSMKALLRRSVEGCISIKAL